VQTLEGQIQHTMICAAMCAMIWGVPRGMAKLQEDVNQNDFEQKILHLHVPHS